MAITFDENKLQRVAIGEVRANSWNPKKDNTEEFKKIVLSVEQNGQRIPIVVREYEGRDESGVITPFEIVDGEQRYKACVALGYKEILIYNEGIMDDDAAKALTIWYQQQVPFDKILEAELVAAMGNVPLPYTEEELDAMREIVEFDWEAVQPEDLVDVDFRSLNLRFTKEAYDVVMTAIMQVRDASNVSNERAVELICADYLAAPDAQEA